jgi:hypothetical protein
MLSLVSGKTLQVMPGIEIFFNKFPSSPSDYLSSMVIHGEIGSLLESSEVVGNIRFSHPTLYVFPGGQGDSALFGINGFNMLGELLLFLIEFADGGRDLSRVSFFQLTAAFPARLASGTLSGTWTVSTLSS